MPLVVVGALGVLGGVLAVRLVLREARRINAELAEVRAAARSDRPETRPTLRRDPATGEYRAR
jgi:hypothetical protein